MAADDDVRVDAGEDLDEPLLGRALGEDVEVVPGRGVAVEHATELHGRRIRVEERDLLVAQLRARLVERARRREPSLARRQLAVGVAAEPENAVAERAQAFEHLRRLLPADRKSTRLNSS